MNSSRPAGAIAPVSAGPLADPRSVPVGAGPCADPPCADPRPLGRHGGLPRPAITPDGEFDWAVTPDGVLVPFADRVTIYEVNHWPAWTDIPIDRLDFSRFSKRGTLLSPDIPVEKE